MVYVEAQQAPVLRPSKREFSRPFTDYVRDFFSKHPDIPFFKVIPPKGWKPSAKEHDLDSLRIQTPIRQHAFGKGGAYVCILEEHRAMSAADFERLANNHQAPPQGGRDDECLERAFWSSVTVNPPLYGADTPLSLFDERLEYGWNLRGLGCLFQDFHVPKIVGVTTPMTYFGMWKSFSGWHKEDVDLNSINYLHFGAPKVWYCVSPKDAARFDEMARTLFPDLHRRCPAFMRHKDILISPKLLRHHGIQFMQTKQEAGEFVVLNHAAYHSVFNLGFNCAEAVNFALPEWLPVGRDAVSCECEALPDGVRIDMGIFFPDLREEEKEGSSDDEEEGSSEEEGEEEESGAASSEEGSGSEEEEEEEEEENEGKVEQPQRRRGRGSAHKAAAARATAPAPAASSRRGARAPAGPWQQQERQQQQQQGASRRRRREAGAKEGGGEDSSEGGENTPANKRQRGAAPAKQLRTPVVPQIPSSAKPSNTPKGAAHPQWGPVAMDKPLALVSRDEGTRALSFQLVHRLARAASKPGALWVGLLTEGADGQYRPSGNSRQVQLGAPYPKLVSVRAEWVESEARRKGAWKLTTKRDRILM